MRKFLTAIFFYVAAFSFAVAQDTASFHIVTAVCVSHHVGYLSWDSVPQASAYTLYRHFPSQNGFSPVATVHSTNYFDSLRRVICADTVLYCVEATVDTSVVHSDTVGIFYQDNIPTSPCSLRLCSVDTSGNRITLSWFPSPDTDVVGYYICIGSPCRDFDTVWGRLNTTYICPPEMARTENNFRILAFDSCYQASPLTPYYHNPILSVSSPPCSRSLHCEWNQYINMPDSVAAYVLYYRTPSDPIWHSHITVPGSPLEFDTIYDDLSIKGVTVWLNVVSRNDSLRAASTVERVRLDIGDTARYARITSATYDVETPAIELRFDIDPLFLGSRCTLMRSDGLDQLFHSIAEIPLPASSYTDLDINRANERYIYRLDIPDLCTHRYTSSNISEVILPTLPPPVAYIPNIFRPDDPDVGFFCPTIVSTLQEGYSFSVYNRFGQIVFRTDNLSDCWDGTTQLGQPVPQGVYIYRVFCHHADGSVRTYTGTVTLLR